MRKNECTWWGLGSVVFAAALLAVFAEISRTIRSPSRRHWALPPKPQVQVLFRKQSLDQRQVQSRHTLTIQNQDLIAWTQTWMQTQECLRAKGLQSKCEMVWRLRNSEKLLPSLKASPSGSTSLTKILLFLKLSMCPVTAKPDQKKSWKDRLIK